MFDTLLPTSDITYEALYMLQVSVELLFGDELLLLVEPAQVIDVVLDMTC